jgi:SAM-dependent methyltransferase
MTSRAEFVLDPSAEVEVRAAYHAKFDAGYGAARVEDYVTGLLDVEHHVQHLREFMDAARPLAPTGSSRLLISGFGAGSEVVAAYRVGFDEVYGVEVDPFLRDIARLRLRTIPSVTLEVYDGGVLPFPDGHFSHLTSSHIIEHTSNPLQYLDECVRVLKEGGVMSLEFPTRFHWKELHSGLPSLEWLPRPVRNAGLRLLSSGPSPLSAASKGRYREIVDTDLKQISMFTIRRGLRRIPVRSSFVLVTHPAPGVIRCLIRKGPPES